MPPAAREDNLICRFWGCDVAVVVRQKGASDRYNIIGRADAAEMVMNRVKTSDIEGSITQYEYLGGKKYQHMDLYLDFETLQKMTS